MSKQVHFTQVFFDTFPCIALLIQNRTREIVAANKQAIEAGITPGDKCYEARYQRTEPCEGCLAPKLWETGEPQQLEVEDSGVIRDDHWVPVDEDTYLNYAFDITEHRRAEEYLKESDERLKGFMASSTEAFFLLDSDLNLIMINQAGLVISPPGTREKDVIGKNILDIAPNLEETGRYEEYLKIIETGEPLFFRDIIPHPKFGDVHLSVKAFKVGNGLGMVIEDITARVQTEQALQESEERYRSLFDESPITLSEQDFSDVKTYIESLRASGVKDLRGYLENHPEAVTRCAALVKVVGVNKTALEMYDARSLDEFRGRLVAILGEESYDVFKEELIALADGETRFESEVINRTLNGEKKHIFLRWSVAQGCEETLSKVIVSVIDITEQVKAEQALRESERRLQLALQGGRLGTWDENYVTGEAIYDEGWAEMLGYTLDQIEPIIGAWEKLVHPDDLSRLEKPYVAHKKGERPFSEVEFRMRAKSGEWRWILSRGKVVEMDEDGNPVRGAGTHQDITERVQAEQALRESEARYRSIFDNSATSLWEEDYNQVKIFIDKLVASGVTDLESYFNEHPEAVVQCASLVKVIDVNQATVDMTQAHQKEDLLKGRDVIFDEAAYQTFQKELVAFAAGETTFTGEITFQTLQGKTRHGIEQVAIAPGYEETWGKVFDSVMDITDRKRTEAVLFASRKLADLGTLAAGVAHEINSPLQIITGTSETAARRLRDGQVDDKRLLRNMNSINHNARHVAHIVRSLMTYAQVGYEEVEPNDLNAIIKDTLLLIEHQLRSQASILITSELPPDLPTLECDRNSITQMLINLLTNARDAMPHGGEITIRTRYDAERGNLVLRVKDTGSGIPEDICPKIFDPFFTTKPMGKGTGLGLSIVLGIVQSHGGEIEVDSQPDRGTTFTITIPEKQIEGLSGMRTEKDGRYSSN